MNNSKQTKIKFIDLFAGIGGFRYALESLGAKCVFSSEIDKHACQMYKENYGDDPYCDITKINANEIPDFDILCAGFPCQTFSISGKQHGFYDETRGTLFFDICRILETKKPTAFILENVQNLEKHDKGRTLSIMLDSLNHLGYSVNYKVLNARDFGVPQNRERIIIVGNKEGIYFDFKKIIKNTIYSMKPFLDNNYEKFEILQKNEYTLLENKYIKTQNKSGLIFCGYRNKKIRTTGVREGTTHLSRVHKQPNRIYSAEGLHPTLASQETSGRYFILNDSIVRKLTINECFRFMGFPDDFKKIGLKSKLYARIGNSVCVNMIQAIGSQIIEQIFNKKEEIKMTPEQFLEETFRKAQANVKVSLPENILTLLSGLAEKEEVFKGVYTVTVTSLTYKSLFPKQDIRRHQIKMENGYSGRTFDTKYVTPFLTNKRFLGAMKESGWLTRSLEQNSYYDYNFKGAINNKTIKKAFLDILDYVQKNPKSAQDMLIYLFSESLNYKKQKDIEIITPITKESNIFIEDIIHMLYQHFYYKYKSRGASILPVIAIQSIYECITSELKRFENKKLDILGSHNSSDRSSGSAGDIVVRNYNNSLYEVVEVKFDITPDLQMVENAYKKIKPTQIQRYYILSTKHCSESEQLKIDKYIELIGNEHGCQFIINGIFPTLKYYLRLINNSQLFIENYINNLKNNTELNAEHKIAWNIIMKKMGYEN